MHQLLMAAKEEKVSMDLKLSIEHLLRLVFEQPALLSSVFMTPLLEAHAGSPLQVRLLAQRLCPAQAPIPELMLDRGEPILERKVLLQGRENTITYLYAETVMVPRVLPPPVCARLLHTDEPIGRILQELRLPTFREIIAHGRASLGEIAGGRVAEYFEAGPSADVFYRTILLYVNPSPQRAAMRITEVMPWACVDDQQDGCAPLALGAIGGRES
jgi:chorismate-pyruvate lyase